MITLALKFIIMTLIIYHLLCATDRHLWRIMENEDSEQ